MNIKGSIIRFFLHTFVSLVLIFYAVPQSIKIGVAKEDIIPLVGTPHINGVSTGVAAPICAKAIVFSQGEVKEKNFSHKYIYTYYGIKNANNKFQRYINDFSYYQ